MKVHDLTQGSKEWLKARLGVVTASQMGPLVVEDKRKSTESRWRPSTSKGVDTLVAKLVTEKILGQPLNDDVGNAFTDRGQAEEADAREEYEEHTGAKVQLVGFITDEHGAGCSPDGLVGDDGGVEIKNPMAHTHIAYLLDNEKLVKEYRHQVQGSLFVTDRAWWDYWSRCPGFPSIHIRAEPDDDYQAALKAAIGDVVERVLAGVESVDAAWSDDTDRAWVDLFIK